MASSKAWICDRIRAMPGVVDVFSARDLPGANQCGALLPDEPILAGEAGDTLRYLGQPVFAVIARTRDAARRAAALAREVVRARALPPILTPQAAHAAQAYVVPPMHLQRGDAACAMAAAPHRLALQFDLGGQEQFYLEGQISYALPTEDGGMKVYCSTQHPSEMQHHVAHALHRPLHAVQVECRRMGGGFGGKESQSAVFACVAAVAAARLGQPVKLRVDRDDDFMITGRRHCFHVEAEVGHDDEGRVLAAEATLISRAGHCADLSGPVMTRALCHFDNAYWLPHVAVHGYSGKTNTQSNTAFRGFGGPQGAFAIEYLIDSVARRLGRDALDVRRANFYGTDTNNVTPYGQTVDDNILHPLVARAGSQQRLPRAPRRHPHLQCQQPGAEKGPGADAAEVRHQLQRHAPEPGRRAGACLHRRQRAREPRRHRNGPGPEHQGGPGGGARTRPAAGGRALHAPPTRRRWPTPRPPPPAPAAT